MFIAIFRYVFGSVECDGSLLPVYFYITLISTGFLLYKIGCCRTPQLYKITEKNLSSRFFFILHVFEQSKTMSVFSCSTVSSKYRPFSRFNFHFTNLTKDVPFHRKTRHSKFSNNYLQCTAHRCNFF